MIKVLFVCLVNICRSPMAEFIFKDMIYKKGLSNEFVIKSAATSYEEIGNDMHYGAKDKLNQKNIPFSKRKATRITLEDYKYYNFIIGMEESNIKNIKRIVGEDVDIDIPIFEAPKEDIKQEKFIDYDRIIDEMPEGLTQIEKARYIYVQLGKYFSYDERYITSQSDEEKRAIFDRDIDDIVDDKVVCTSLSRIYENLLNRVGIKAKTVLIPGERLGHAFTELEIDGNKYFTGLIRDLMRIKTGFKTKEFMIDNPDRFGEDSEYTILTEEELKRIDDKIGYTYNRYVYGRFYENVKRRNEFT